MDVLLQIWHVVQWILLVSGIIGALERIGKVLKACREFLSVKEETALDVFVGAMIRPPQKYLIEPLLPIAVRLTCYSILVGILIFAAASLIKCGGTART